MSLPSFPNKDQVPSRDEAINQILSSIAMEELGLSHIINAEGEKLQYALGTIPNVPKLEEPPSMDDLLEINKSIHKTLDSAMLNQFFLKEKLNSALNASILQGPTGERGPQGPVSIEVNPVVDILEPGQSLYVHNDGTPEYLVLRFGIPKGEKGDVGTILGSYDTLEELEAAHSTGNQGDAYLVGGSLYVWDTEEEAWSNVGDLHGEKGDVGTILGSYDTLEELEAAHSTGNQGDAYLVDGDLYVWDTAEGLWHMTGRLQGPEGPQGVGTTIKGSAVSKEALDTEKPDGPPEDSYLVNGELYIWNPQDHWHSAGSLRGPSEIQFFTTDGMRFQSGVSGDRAYSMMVGLGGEVVASQSDPVTIKFPMRAVKTITGGIVTDIAVTLSITVSSGDALGTRVTAQLYTTSPYNSKHFVPVPNTVMTMDIPVYTPAETVFTASLSGLSEIIPPASQLLMGFYNESAGLGHGFTAIMSGTIIIR